MNTIFVSRENFLGEREEKRKRIGKRKRAVPGEERSRGEDELTQ